MYLQRWIPAIFVFMLLVNSTIVQAFLKSEQVQAIEGIQIVYILPKEIKQSSNTISGLMFEEYDNGVESKMQRLHWGAMEKGGFQIKRSVDNGGVGSGVVYTVDVKTISKPDRAVVTLIPKTQETYQEGLILPFPIPEFNIEAYLSNAMFYHTFELNSVYPVNAIKANFDRLLAKHGGSKNTYSINIDDETLKFTVEPYPYRNGSKIVVHARLHSKKLRNGVVNLNEQMTQLKKEIEGIINS